MDTELATPTLPPLPEADRRLLGQLFLLNTNLQALAASTNLDLIDLYRWSSRPDIAAYIAYHRTQNLHSLRQWALSTLADLAKSATDPIERHRALALILGHHRSERSRPTTPPRPPASYRPFPPTTPPTPLPPAGSRHCNACVHPQPQTTAETPLAPETPPSPPAACPPTTPTSPAPARSTAPIPPNPSTPRTQALPPTTPSPLSNTPPARGPSPIPSRTLTTPNTS